MLHVLQRRGARAGRGVAGVGLRGAVIAAVAADSEGMSGGWSETGRAETLAWSVLVLVLVLVAASVMTGMVIVEIGAARERRGCWQLRRGYWRCCCYLGWRVDGVESWPGESAGVWRGEGMLSNYESG